MVFYQSGVVIHPLNYGLISPVDAFAVKLWQKQKSVPQDAGSWCICCSPLFDVICDLSVISLSADITRSPLASLTPSFVS